MEFAVSVLDVEMRPVSTARVSLTPVGAPKRAKAVAASFQPRRQKHVARRVAAGTYALRVSAKGLESQERLVRVSPTSHSPVSVVLGPKDAPWYYRGETRVPFSPMPGVLMATILPAEPETVARVDDLASQLGLESLDLAEGVGGPNLRQFRLTGRFSRKRFAAAELRLRTLPEVAHVGAPVLLKDDVVAFLSNTLVVWFEGNVGPDEVVSIADQLGLDITRPAGALGNAYLLEGREHTGYELVATGARLLELAEVEFVEPNLVSTSTLDTVTPQDHLYPQQWNLPLTNLHEAWEVLKNLDADQHRTFGSPDLTIAIVDTGVQSQTTGGVTVARHPDLQGAVTSGAPKAAGFFNFLTMASNNDALSPESSDYHGTACAGIAVAAANNPSPLPAEKEGIAGVAPNCRLFGVVRPYMRSEMEYSDAYVWLAGFDSGSTLPGFPAPLTSGVDVICSAYGAFIHLAITRTMTETFDFLTTYGRAGKGTLLFFSAGNNATTPGNAGEVEYNRPWAAYERNFAVAASTADERHQDDSNHGTQVDVCAPGGSGATGLGAPIATTKLGEGGTTLGEAGHTGGPLDYLRFGGTSAATPHVAGIAALMLSANPQLTWLDVRRIIKETSVRIDNANTDPIGQWVGTGPDRFSQWYGYGRIDALAAVQAALAFSSANLVVRDNLADTGAGVSGSPFWDSPDLWVRTQNPATDTMALPAGYTVAGPDQQPSRAAGASNTVYVRVKNVSTTQGSSQFYVRVYLASFGGTEFIYPDDFRPDVRPGANPGIGPLARGTYLLGQVLHDPLGPGEVTVMHVPWPANLIPPETVDVGGMPVLWHPCLLAEISPHEGAPPWGPHVWESNNLAQRNVTFATTAGGSGASAAAAIAVSGGAQGSEARQLEVYRGTLPDDVRLWLSFPGAPVKDVPRPREPDGGIVLESDATLRFGGGSTGAEVVLKAARGSVLFSREDARQPSDGEVGSHRGRAVRWLPADPKVTVAIPPSPAGARLALIGGEGGTLAPGESHEVAIVELDEKERRVGAAAIVFGAQAPLPKG